MARVMAVPPPTGCVWAHFVIYITEDYTTL